MFKLKVGKSPSESFTLTNKVTVNPNDHASGLRGASHVVVTAGPGQHFIFTCEATPEMGAGLMGFSVVQRKWAMLSVNQELDCKPHVFDDRRDLIGAMVLHVDFYNKKKPSQESYDTDAMAREFLAQFPNLAFTVNQPLVFQFQNKALLSVTVGDIQLADVSAMQQGKDAKMTRAERGRSFPNTDLVFEKGEGSPIILTGKSKSKVVRQSIINPDWDFSKMGIGGLDKEFNAIFRRAFASRVFPHEIMEQLGCKHVKGMLCVTTTSL